LHFDGVKRHFSKENISILVTGDYFQINKCILCKECIKLTCGLQIPSYRIPRYIRFTTEFPRTTVSDKVNKKELLEKLLSEIHNTN